MALDRAVPRNEPRVSTPRSRGICEHFEQARHPPGLLKMMRISSRPSPSPCKVAVRLPATDPTALTGTFTNDATKQIQWRAFLNKSRVAETSLPLVSVIDRLRAFLLPVIAAARTGAAFHLRWRGGAWDADG
jgi:hypothetical protein